MRTKPDKKCGTASRTTEILPENWDRVKIVLEEDREFVLNAIAMFAESDCGVLHERPDEAPRLYLITGETFRFGDSGITRLS